MRLAKFMWVGFAAVYMLSAKLSFAGALSDGAILDRAAKQRTLVMSVAKNYVLGAANIEVKASLKEQANAIAQFDNNLDVLKFNAPNTYVRKSLKTLGKDWDSYRALLDLSPTLENVEAVIEASNKLVFVSDLITSNWHGLSSNRQLEALNLSHHQAMLSERIGLLYAAHYYGVKSDWVVMELNATLLEYEKSLSFLKRFMGQDSSIVSHLEQVGNQWDYAKQGFAKFNQGHYLPKVIAVTMESMQEEMNMVAEHYSRSYVSDKPSFSSLSVPGLAANIE